MILFWQRICVAVDVRNDTMMVERNCAHEASKVEIVHTRGLCMTMMVGISDSVWWGEDGIGWRPNAKLVDQW